MLSFQFCGTVASCYWSSVSFFKRTKEIIGTVLLLVPCSWMSYCYFVWIVVFIMFIMYLSINGIVLDGRMVFDPFSVYICIYGLSFLLFHASHWWIAKWYRLLNVVLLSLFLKWYAELNVSMNMSSVGMPLACTCDVIWILIE